MNVPHSDSGHGPVVRYNYGITYHSIYTVGKFIIIRKKVLVTFIIFRVKMFIIE